MERESRLADSIGVGVVEEEVPAKKIRIDKANTESDW